MAHYRVTFDSPWHLLLLVLVPLVWWWSYRGLAALGQFRRWMALLLRSAVLVLFIAAAAQMQMVRTSNRLTVIYLLDQSASVPVEARRGMIQYVNEAIRRHREREDRVGVIVFGRDAAIEVPSFDYNVQLPMQLESPVDPANTNLAAAMRLALASFPEDAARRVVVVSDGNENLGNALEEAQGLAAAGVGVDVVPVRYQHRGEVIVERVIIPNDIRRGQPFDLKIVVSNVRGAAGDGGEVRGKLRIRQRSGEQSVTLSEESVTLPPGKKVFTARQQLDSTGFFTYEAEFLPDRSEDDTMPQNNRATAFTHVKGKGQVLLIAQNNEQGQYAHLVDALRKYNIDVKTVPSTQPFTTLAELQQFDSVILANVPRDDFADDRQVQMLVRNTQQMGAGLVMLGGPDSFGAGGWNNTELEAAMPVDFHVKSSKVIPRGALAMVMHASEIAQGNFWQHNTLLRAIGANCVLALTGAPVCAASCELSELYVLTSMRVKDSLERGVSYFYAEVSRLKVVLDEATRRRGQVLFLLDEILLGTNTMERQLASREVLALLLATGAMGAVSTHDLQLATLEQSPQFRVRNVHFRDTLKDDQMTFDYRLRDGVVDTTNALRVLRQAGIPVTG